MSRGRPASLHQNDHRRPDPLQSLVVIHTNEKGDRQARYDFNKLPIPGQLKRELAELVAEKVRPTGTWRSIETSQGGWDIIGQFARWLAEQETVPTQIAEIDLATWLRWQMSRPDSPGGRSAVKIMTRILRNNKHLPADTRRDMARAQPGEKAQEASYSDDEVAKIARRARHVFGTAERRILKNIVQLQAFRSGSFAVESDDYLVGQALDVLAATADVPHERRRSSGERFLTPELHRVLGGSVAESTWKRLFLDENEALAAMMLIAYEQGWNQTTIRELCVPRDLSAGTGPPIYSIQLEKRRRHPPHRYETRSLADDGPQSGGRLFTRILAVTEPARTICTHAGVPTERLILFRRYRLRGFSTRDFYAPDYIKFEVTEHAQKRWRQDTGHYINFRRIRKTINVRHRRQPNQNSRATHDAVYALRDPNLAVESEPVIASGITNAITHAKGLLAKISEENKTDLDDTPTAGCTNNFDSPFSRSGVSCSASFFLCLACINAVVMPRHLGRLAYLHECLSQLRGSLAPAAWNQDWAAHYNRLHDLRTNHYNDAQWRDALTKVSKSEKTSIDYLMAGRLDA